LLNTFSRKKISENNKKFKKEFDEMQKICYR